MKQKVKKKVLQVKWTNMKRFSFVKKGKCPYPSKKNDDLIMATPTCLIEEGMGMVLRFFAEIGLPIQQDKIEKMLPCPEGYVPDEMFRVLGLNMQLFEGADGKMAFLEISVPTGRAQAIMDMIAIMEEQLQAGKLTLKLAQETTGSIVSALIHKRHKISKGGGYKV